MLEAVQKRAATVGGYFLNGTLTHLPGRNPMRLVCKNFVAQALLKEKSIYVLLTCLTFYIRGILYRLILFAPSSPLLI